MPFEVTDNLTKKTLIFEKNPTEQDLLEAFEQPEEKSPGITPFIGRGIATGLGAPVDIVAAGLRATGLNIPKKSFGGRESIESGMKAIGIPIAEREPKYTPEYIGAGIGEATGALLPGGAAAKLLARGKGLAGIITRNIVESMAKHPYSTLGTEITAGGGMGIGRQVGEKHPVIRPLTEMAGGMVGGMGPTTLALMPSRLAVREGKTVLGKVTLPFTEAGAKYRAGEFLKKQVAKPEEIAKLATKETIGKLPPTVATGEKRLMAIYNQLRSKDPTIDAEVIERLSKSAFKLEQELRAMGSGSLEILRDITEKRIVSLELGMDKRTTQAMEIAQRKLDALPIATRKSQESIIVRNELTKVMRQEDQLVKDIWKQVPKNVVVETKNTKNIFNNIVEDLATAQQGDIPVVLRNSNIVKEGGIGLTTVNEMQGLRSKLLEVSRQARANNQWNRARIADDVSDAILEDLGASAKATKTPEGEVLSTAIAATKKFKSRFEQGITGKILGYEKTSAPSIAPELTLDISIGRMKERGAVDISKVVVTPEAKEATERYLTRSFTDYSLDNKTKVIDPIKSEKWIKNNEAILDQFPDLRTKLTDASESQKLAINTKTLMDARKVKLRDPKISVAAKFLKTDIGDEIKTTLKSPKPIRTTIQLVMQARKDSTGQTLEGLRGGFIEHILETSSMGAYNDIGERTLSGNAMLGFINKNRDVLKQVFPQEQMLRMRKIGGELSKLEFLEKTKGMNIEYSDAMSNIIRFASRFSGAAAGRHWGRMVGAGGTVQIPGFFASQWGKIASKLTKNRFEQLINDAIISPDGKLLEALLLPINKPQTTSGMNNIKVLNARINAWMLGTGSRVVKDIEEEPD